jgi:hypothetical protein
MIAHHRLKLAGTVGNQFVDVTHDDEPVLSKMRREEDD